MIGTPTPITQQEFGRRLETLNFHRDNKIPYQASYLARVQTEIVGKLVKFTLTNERGYSWVEEYWLVNG